MLTLTPQQVVGTLKATGSTDIDVLHAKRGSMLTVWKVVRVVALLLMAQGALISLTIVGALIGLPEVALGFWLWRKGDGNVATITSTFADYTASLAAPDAATTSTSSMNTTTGMPAITPAITPAIPPTISSAVPTTGAVPPTVRSEILS